ncbi:NAD(+) diphosphatase [Actinomyces weissii]|uniref:NAD(+) diphosphatase n=1 Tax=Actinomyces weissii TaxID=675090 RepID=A0A7T7S1R4_9ACTO|nr:NAD(+) diphosphatase [Actinomyces weissii]QQM66882.1 NAD(+) diphosphatase [Actinomyces weissii]
MSPSPDQPSGPSAPSTTPATTPLAAPSGGPTAQPGTPANRAGTPVNPPGWFRSLSRHSTDRDAARRSQPGLLARLLKAPSTRVLLVDPRGRVSLAAPTGTPDLPDDGLTPAVPSDADRAVWQQDSPGDGAMRGLRLAPLAVADLPASLLTALTESALAESALAEAGAAPGPASERQPPPPADSPQAIYLGQEEQPARPTSWIAVVVPPETATDAALLGTGATLGAPTGGSVPDAEGAAHPHPGLLSLLARYPLTALRAVGAELDAHDAGLAAPAIALAAWHARSRFCPACGGPLSAVQAGWARRCQACGALHFPRTDPAVITAATDEQDRLLLVHGATWPQQRYSVVAGFVEAGESAEQAVLREVAEETGLQVASVEPFSTQPWPFPRSLMLAYRARLVPGQQRPVPDGQEVTDALLLSRTELVEALEAGRIGLPGATSIARALMEDWFGGPLPQ